ncbi:hypothetical protein LLG95_04990 [bacterium]|nr:hypothetical protein [bacterium]
MNRIRIAATLFGILALTSPAAWPASTSWQPVAQPAAGWYPYYQQHGAAVYFNNSFWVIGGDTLIRRSSNGAAWEKAADGAPFGKRFGHCLLVFNNKLWLIGGAGSNKFSDFQLKNDVWSSSNGTSWTQVVANAPWSPRRIGQ